MTDFEFILHDRLQKIRQVIKKYGEENFYISFSGGKDSTVLSALVDMSVPNNKIPRVYANTGIEWNMIRDFVFDMSKVDDRVKIIKPTVPIKQMRDTEGHPFKSKEHSLYVDVFQRNGWTKTAQRYLYPSEGRKNFRCPKILRYQFEGDNTLRISDKCCKRLKEQPIDEWAKNNNKSYSILGIMQAEGGRRNRAQCLAFRGKKLKAFQPLAPITKE